MNDNSLYNDSIKFMYIQSLLGYRNCYANYLGDTQKISSCKYNFSKHLLSIINNNNNINFDDDEKKYIYNIMNDIKNNKY